MQECRWKGCDRQGYQVTLEMLLPAPGLDAGASVIVSCEVEVCPEHAEEFKARMRDIVSEEVGEEASR